MACATLKRSLDWEAINQRPTKRRRCNAFGQPFGSESSATVCDSQTSPFTEDIASKMSPDVMSQNIREEIKRLHRRRQHSSSSAAVELMQDSESSGSEMGPDSPRRSDSPRSIARNPEKALFTFKQVQLICERMLKEREDDLREKYDAVLTSKLAEQYDAFVKFSYDQIQKRYEAAPSYLS